MKWLLNKKIDAGITLIALVITIIVLLILAGVTVATLTGENGLLSKAQLAKERNIESEQDEKDKLSSYENELSNYNTNSSRLTGNREYGYFTMSANGSIGTTEAKIPFNQKQDGNMNINSETYEVSLTAGKTYFISAGIYKGSGGYTFMYIKDNLTTQLISKHGFANGSGDPNGGANPIQCIYTPIQNCTISVFAFSDSNSRPVECARSFFIIYEL